MTEMILDLANEALRTGVIEAVRRMPETSLYELCGAVEAGPYAKILQTVTVAELQTDRTAEVVRVRSDRGENPRQAILRAFQNHPSHAFSSGLFIRQLGLPRWTIRKLLGELVELGLIRQTGKTGATRYRLVVDESSKRLRRHARGAGEG